MDFSDSKDPEILSLQASISNLKDENTELKITIEEELHLIREKNNILIENNENLEHSLQLKCQELEDMVCEWNVMKDKYETALHTLQAQNFEIEEQNDIKLQSQKTYEKSIRILSKEILHLKDLNSDLVVEMRFLNEKLCDEISGSKTRLNKKHIEFSDLQQKYNELYQEWQKIIEIKADVTNNTSNKNDETPVGNGCKISVSKIFPDLAEFSEVDYGQYTPNLHPRIGIGYKWQTTPNAFGMGPSDLQFPSKQSFPLLNYQSSPMTDIDCNICPIISPSPSLTNNNSFLSFCTFNNDLNRKSVQIMMDGKLYNSNAIENDFWMDFQSIFDRYDVGKCLTTLKKEMRGFLFSIVTRNMFEIERNEVFHKSVGEWEERYEHNIRVICENSHVAECKQC